jgi:hypothetical protein
MQIEFDDNEAATKSTQTQDSGKNVSSQEKEQALGKTDELDPTRYGDWEKNGRCIDF